MPVSELRMSSFVGRDMPERSLQQLFLDWSDLFATMKHIVQRAGSVLAPLLLNCPRWYALKLDLLGAWSVARILPFSIHQCSQERALSDSNVLPQLMRLCVYLYRNRQFTVVY